MFYNSEINSHMGRLYRSKWGKLIQEGLKKTLQRKTKEIKESKISNKIRQRDNVEKKTKLLLLNKKTFLFIIFNFLTVCKTTEFYLENGRI